MGDENSNKPTFTHETFPIDRMRLGSLAKGFFTNPTYKTTHLCTFVVAADGDEGTLLDYILDAPPAKGGSLIYYLADDSPNKPTLYVSQELHPTFSKLDEQGCVSRATTAKSRAVEQFWRRWHARVLELLKERAATKEGLNFLIKVMGTEVLENLDTCLALPFTKQKYGDKHQRAGQINEDASVQLKYKIWSQEVGRMREETRQKHDQDVADGKKILMVPGTDIVIYTAFYEMIKGVRESKEPITDYAQLKRYVYCKTPNANASRQRGDMFSKVSISAPSLVFNPAKNHKGTVSCQLVKQGIMGFNVYTRNGAMNDAQYAQQQQEAADAMDEAGFVQEAAVDFLAGADLALTDGDGDGFNNKRQKRGDGGSLQLGGHALLKRDGDGADGMGCDPDVAHDMWLQQQDDMY